MNQQLESVNRFQLDAINYWRNSGSPDVPENECCDLYLTSHLRLTPNSHVIEVGGYLGKWSSFINKRFQCFVDVYEPVKQFYYELVNRFSNSPKIQVLNFGLGSRSEVVRISLSDDGSSLFGESLDKAEAFIKDASDVVRNTRSVDLLCLNCEGSEYDILDRLISTDCIKYVKAIMVQFHSNLPDVETRRNNIREKLSKTHTEVFCYPFVWEIWNIKK